MGMCECTCEDEEFKWKIELKTDDYPGDTNWTLTTSTGETINKNTFEADTLYIDEYCLVDGNFTITVDGKNNFTNNSTNNFTIIDIYDDDFEGGYYKIYTDNTLVISEENTEFSKEEYYFCSTKNHCSHVNCTDAPAFCNKGTKMCQCTCKDEEFKLKIELKTDKYPQDTDWTLTTSTGQIIAQKNTFEEYTEYVDEYCLVDGNFTITDKYGDGLNQGLGGYYNISVNNKLVISEVKTAFSKQEYVFCSVDDHCSDY